MRVRNISDGPRLVPGLGVAVDPDGVIDAPADWATGALEQVWYWEAADDQAKALVAAHPEWWDHPYVAEMLAGGGKVAARPKAKTAAKEGN